jgi:hypothetical protein
MEKDALYYLNVESLYESNSEYNLQVELYNEAIAKKNTNTRRFIIAEYAGRLRRYKPSKDRYTITHIHDIMSIAFTCALRSGVAEEDNYIYLFDKSELNLIKKLKGDSFHRKPFNQLTNKELTKEIQIHCYFGISHARYCFFLEQEFRKYTGESTIDFQKEVQSYLQEQNEADAQPTDIIEEQSIKHLDDATHKLQFLGKPAHLAFLIDLLMEKGYIRKEGSGEGTAKILLRIFKFENYSPSIESLGKLLHKDDYPIKDDQVVKLFNRIPSRDELN